ncbi:MAG: BMC domain-containing protein [Planctomycetota bacterium]|nr:MAG: BMC domain-containing protein [Planctomycetota bacterium]
MTRGPAIALLELDGAPAGTVAADAMVKAAPIAAIRCGTVQPGKYVILIDGGVAEVEESLRAGRRTAGAALIDELLLPDVHPQVCDAIDAARRSPSGDALAIVETQTLAAVLAACDAAVKGAAVEIVEIRLGDGLGGRGLAHLTGAVTDAQAAVEIAQQSLADRGAEGRAAVIPLLHDEVGANVSQSTRFFGAP